MLDDDELRRTVEDLRKLFEQTEDCDPRVRVYVDSDQPPSVDLRIALPEYEGVMPHPAGQFELALLRKITFESEALFRAECKRVAAAIAPLLNGNSRVECCYDNARGATTFELHLRKTAQNPELAEYNPNA